MRQIIFLNRYFFPDHSATSQILSDLAFHLAACGESVVVITSRQLYDDPRASLPQAETVDGVRIHRIATTRFGRAALLGRGFDYLSSTIGMWRTVLGLARPGDVIVAKTDPPLVCVAAMAAARQRGCHLINWLQDLYPEVAVQLGVPLLAGAPGRAMFRLRDAALRRAVANVVVGADMGARVQARGVAAERICYIPNWCDDQSIRPVSQHENPLRREWDFEDRFVVGYSGNLGRTHEFETLLGAADRLRDISRITFPIIGGGALFEGLRRRVAEQGLTGSFRFLPYQDRANLMHSLGASDMHWLSLKPEFEGLVVPSKLYGIAAAGRPVIAIAAPHGEVARLVREHACGIVIAPGDADTLSRELRDLSENPARVAEMGQRARAMLEANFTRRHALARWRDLLDTVG